MSSLDSCCIASFSVSAMPGLYITNQVPAEPKYVPENTSRILYRLYTEGPTYMAYMA